MSEWIKCSDRLPKLGYHCLIWIPVCGNFEIEGAFYNGGGQWLGAWCSTRGQDSYYHVRYWKPAGEMPE